MGLLPTVVPFPQSSNLDLLSGTNHTSGTVLKALYVFNSHNNIGEVGVKITYFIQNDVVTQRG